MYSVYLLYRMWWQKNVVKSRHWIAGVPSQGSHSCVQCLEKV